MDQQPITAQTIKEAFERLGTKLSRRGVTGEVYIFGGASMVLAFDSRKATRDIDAIFMPHGPVHDEIIAVAEEMNLPRYWMNEQASVYLGKEYKSGAAPIFEHQGLRVFTISAEHLLAMKATAARLVDVGDILFLTHHLGLTSFDEIAELVNKIFPGQRISDRARRVILDALEEDQIPDKR